jgi:hypothetical protein
MRRVFQSIAFSLLLSGCFGPGEGVEVPVEQIYFPVGLALDAKSEHLFVVSSDFDLQYNGGAVQSYALADLAEKIATPCSVDADCGDSRCDDGLCARFGGEVCSEGDRGEAERLLYPGRCNPITVKPSSSVKIGAFATDAVMRQRPEGASEAGGGGAPERLFIPVRGDSTLHWIDVRDGVLDCGEGSDGGCDDAHRAGNEPDQNSRDLRLGPEPFGIAATETGRTLVVTNQTTGSASVFVNDWETSVGPRLRFALTTDSTSLRPTGVASLPLRRAISTEEPPAGVFNAGDDQAAFLMTYRNSPQVRVLRFSADLGSSPERDFLSDGGGVVIDANSSGSDSRGITVDGSARRAAVLRCGDDAACLTRAELVPLDVYVANRKPASLLIGRTQPPLDQPYFFQSLPLTVGPSRVVVGSVRVPSGELETRVFVICFDSRRIFIYDPKHARFEAELLTGRGPHSVAVDTQASRLYVGHFTDSFIGVFSLDLSHPETYGTMLGTLGVPKPPRASK